MTITTTANRYSYGGNDVTTNFAYSSKFLANADLVVVLIDTLGVETRKTLTTHYTLTGAGDASGGTVTMITPPATGETLVIYGDPSITQSVDLVAYDNLAPDAQIETPLDRLTVITQRLNSRADRALHQGELDTAAIGTIPAKATRASKYLAFDANGDPLASTGTGTDAGLRADLAASGGANLLGFMQNGSGAAATTVQARLREVISIKDFGAVGDGVTDDTAAIQAACSAANYSLTASKDVFFPSGTYLINSTVTVNPNYTDGSVPQIIGEGAANTIIKAGGSLGANPVLSHQGASPAFNTKWEGVTIQGTGAANGQYGIHHINTCFVNYEGVVFDALQEAIRFENVGAGFTEQNVLTSCWINACKYGLGFRRQAGSTQDSFRGTGFASDCHMNISTVADSRLIRVYNDTALPPNLYNTPINVSLWADGSSIVTQNDGTTPIRAAGILRYESSSNFTLGSGSAADTFRGTLDGISFSPVVGTYRLLDPYSVQTKPAFSARNSASQNVTSGVWTKVVFDTEIFDTNSNFASSAFTPTVAGYYQINTSIRLNSSGTSSHDITIYKNGAAYTSISGSQADSGTDHTFSGSDLIYCNGTTDYIEIYALMVGGGTPNFGYATSAACCKFSGNLVSGDIL